MPEPLVLSDSEIARLLALPKNVVSGDGTLEVINNSERAEFEVESVGEGAAERFVVFVRRLIKDPSNFTCGLRWRAPDGHEVILLRCNRHPAPHRNMGESESVSECHIHRATERYMEARKSPEGFAEGTEAYSELAGAAEELARLCNLQGLKLRSAQPTMFGQP